MSTAQHSRDEARKYLAQLIENKSELVEEVFDYRTEDFEGVTPVILVTSAGTGRERITLRGTKASFYLGVETFVLQADLEADPPWTPSEAEDMLDKLEQEVAQILATDVREGPWQSVAYEERSLTTTVMVGGSAYLYEVIPIVVEVL